jgi:putative transposon-encoded protein
MMNISPALWLFRVQSKPPKQSLLLVLGAEVEVVLAKLVGKVGKVGKVGNPRRRLPKRRVLPPKKPSLPEHLNPKPNPKPKAKEAKVVKAEGKVELGMVAKLLGEKLRHPEKAKHLEKVELGMAEKPLVKPLENQVVQSLRNLQENLLVVIGAVALVLANQARENQPQGSPALAQALRRAAAPNPANNVGAI